MSWSFSIVDEVNSPDVHAEDRGDRFKKANNTSQLMLPIENTSSAYTTNATYEPMSGTSGIADEKSKHTRHFSARESFGYKRRYRYD